MRALVVVLVVVLVVGLGGLVSACGTEYGCDQPVEAWGVDGLNCFVDPAIKVNASQLIEEVKGDPYVELGFYKEQLYEELLDGADWPIEKQSQGGVWAMPALRMAGIASPALVECTCVTETGEEIGHVKVKQKFYLATDGYLEIQTFPIPAREPADDLYGLDATVNCVISDKVGRTSSRTVDVVIIKG